MSRVKFAQQTYVPPPLALFSALAGSISLGLI